MDLLGSLAKKERNACTDCTCMVRARNHGLFQSQVQLKSTDWKKITGAATIALSTEDLREIEEAAAKITVQVKGILNILNV